MQLADYISRDMELILLQWDAFAATLIPLTESLPLVTMRGQAKEGAAGVRAGRRRHPAACGGRGRI
ncbi:hypothetical protein [Paraburkholderia lycopersici]|uniref:Uncharacterized protein n=1 Tax=Paraburkholderia lycopersici TaxID=416944 RepID=A0A1G7CDJ9_9BURK|nr:hypothetical protein [Paraburkholderia lycopersici]SDE37418.1 hypothetical protein SAMN05421548_14438 [Paraburkholderia lycopersici]